MTRIIKFNQNDPRELFLGFTRSFEPIPATENGYQQITMDDNDSFELIVPDNAVSAAITVEAGIGSTEGSVLARYLFGQNPTSSEGNPVYDAMYFELATKGALDQIRFIRSSEFSHILNVQYFKEIITK